MKPQWNAAKDPDSTEPYGFDWTSYLTDLGTGVVITASEWFITESAESPSTLEIDSDLIQSDQMRTQATFSGGTIGSIYRVTNRITTGSSPVVTDDRSVLFTITQK
jgi:hypothetical protein